MKSKLLTRMKTYRKKLVAMPFSVTPCLKKGQYRVRFGKKYVIIDCPDRETAIELIAEFKLVVKKSLEKVDIKIYNLERHAEQLKLQFSEGDNSDGKP